jgi:hypothetical protein
LRALFCRLFGGIGLFAPQAGVDPAPTAKAPGAVDSFAKPTLEPNERLRRQARGWVAQASAGDAMDGDEWGDLGEEARLAWDNASAAHHSLRLMAMEGGGLAVANAGFFCFGDLPADLGGNASTAREIDVTLCATEALSDGEELGSRWGRGLLASAWGGLMPAGARLATWQIPVWSLPARSASDVVALAEDLSRRGFVFSPALQRAHSPKTADLLDRWAEADALARTAASAMESRSGSGASALPLAPSRTARRI